MSQIRYADAALDPAGALALLLDQELAAERRLTDLRQQIELVKRLCEIRREWVGLFGEDPAPGSGGTALPAAGSADVPRRLQVAALLRQDPACWWKARAIGQALSIDNLKSLRVLLEQLVRKGVLVRSSDAWYRFNDGAQVPEPVRRSHRHREVAQSPFATEVAPVH